MTRIKTSMLQEAEVQRTKTEGDRLQIYQKPTFAGKKLIYICSPLRPQSPDPHEADMELFENLFRARNACELVKGKI